MASSEPFADHPAAASLPVTDNRLQDLCLAVKSLWHGEAPGDVRGRAGWPHTCLHAYEAQGRPPALGTANEAGGVGGVTRRLPSMCRGSGQGWGSKGAAWRGAGGAQGRHLRGSLSPQSKQRESLRAGQGDTGSGSQGCAPKENVRRRGCSFQGRRKGHRTAGCSENALSGQVQAGTE